MANSGVSALRTAAVQRAVMAPELERFLSRKSVDLLVTDQIEAIEVRIRRGIEVFDRKIETGLKVARKRTAVLTICSVAGLLLLIACFLEGSAGNLGSNEFVTWFRWGLALVVLIAVVLVDLALVRTLADHAQLQQLAGRYARGVKDAKTIEELLSYGENILGTARQLGAVP